MSGMVMYLAQLIQLIACFPLVNMSQNLYLSHAGIYESVTDNNIKVSSSCVVERMLRIFYVSKSSFASFVKVLAQNFDGKICAGAHGFGSTNNTATGTSPVLVITSVHRSCLMYMYVILDPRKMTPLNHRHLRHLHHHHHRLRRIT